MVLKYLSLIIVLFLSIIAVYSIFDVFTSFINVVRYEAMTWQSLGFIFGKIMFFILILAIIMLFYKIYKKSRG